MSADRRHHHAAALVGLLLPVLLSAVAMASPRQWPVGLNDPERPDRPVTAVLVADPAATAPCPVVVLAHATLTGWEHYAALADTLAGTGWLVALPTTEMGLPGDQAALAADMTFLASALRQGHPDLPADLPARSSGPHALVGHSLGGGAAVVAAADDPLAGVLALLAPQERPRPSMIGRAPDVQAPALILAGELDCVTPPAEHQQPLFTALGSSTRALALVLGGGHCSFAEPSPACLGGESWCPPTLPSASQQALTRRLVTGWLAWRLRGDAAAGAQVLTDLAAPPLATERVGLPTAAGTPAAAARLRRAGPAPASGTAHWRLELSAAALVQADIFDLRGRRVARVSRGSWPAGVHDLRWDGRQDGGRRAPAGVYLLRVRAGSQVFVDRILRLD